MMKFSIEILGEQVQKLLLGEGIKDQQQSDQMVGVQRAISRWKPGECRPSVDTLLVIEEVFGKSSGWLLTGEELLTFHTVQPIIIPAGTQPEIP